MEYKVYKILKNDFLKKNKKIRKFISFLLFILGMIIVIIPLPFSVPIGILLIIIGTILSIIGEPKKIKDITKLKKNIIYLIKFPLSKKKVLFKIKDIKKNIKKIFFN